MYKNKQKHAEYQKDWANKNKEKVMATQKRHKLKNWEKVMWHCSKFNAKKMGREFNIEVEDIKIPEYCPLLNIRLTREVFKGRVGSNPSLDRIDNDKGYIRGNVRVISEKANRVKMNLSNQELITLANNILKLCQE